MQPPYETGIDSFDDTIDNPEPRDPRPATGGNLPAPALLTAMSAVMLGVTAGLLWLLYQLITGLGGLLTDGGRTATSTGRDLLGWLADGPITTTVTDPVRGYLDSHATGLPATAGQLWTTWLVLAGVLLLVAAAGSTGARIGWTVFGALTTAMAYAGTTGGGQALAAGVTAGLWALLSIPAFAHRRGGGHDITVITTPAPREPSTDTEPAPAA